MEVLKVTTVEEVVSILLPQTPEKARELVRWSFYKRPPRMPSWFLWDFIELLPADCHLLLPSLRRILSIIRATFEEKLLLQGCCNGPFIGCDDFLLLPHLFLSKLCCTVSQGRNLQNTTSWHQSCAASNWGFRGMEQTQVQTNCNVIVMIALLIMNL